MKQLRYVNFILVIVMVVSLLAACAPAGTTGTPVPPGMEPTMVPATTTMEPQAVPEAEDFIVEGAISLIIAPYGLSGPCSQDGDVFADHVWKRHISRGDYTFEELRSLMAKIASEGASSSMITKIGQSLSGGVAVVVNHAGKTWLLLFGGSDLTPTAFSGVDRPYIGKIFKRFIKVNPGVNFAPVQQVAECFNGALKAYEAKLATEQASQPVPEPVAVPVPVPPDVMANPAALLTVAEQPPPGTVAMFMNSDGVLTPLSQDDYTELIVIAVALGATAAIVGFIIAGPPGAGVALVVIGL